MAPCDIFCDNRSEAWLAEFRVTSLKFNIRGVLSDNRDCQMHSTIFIKQTLDDYSDDPYDLIYTILKYPDVVPRLVDLFNINEVSKDFKYVVAYVLAILTKADDIQILIDGGALPTFNAQLSSQRGDKERLMAVFALGRIAANSSVTRDHVLNSGTMVPLTALFNDTMPLFNDPNFDVPSKMKLIKVAAKTLLHLCSNVPLPAASRTNPAIPVLVELLHPHFPEDVLENAVLALTYLTQASNKATIQLVVNSGAIHWLLYHLGHPNSKIQCESLSTIRHIVASGYQPHTRAVLDYPALPVLTTLLTHTQDDEVKTLVLRIVMNITTTPGNINLVVASRILKPVLRILGSTKDNSTLEFSLLIFGDATSRKDDKTIRFLVEHGCIEAICNVFTCTVEFLVEKALEVLECILQVDDSYVRTVVDAGGKNRLELLCLHRRQENVSVKAANIINWYL